LPVAQEAIARQGAGLKTIRIEGGRPSRHIPGVGSRGLRDVHRRRDPAPAPGVGVTRGPGAIRLPPLAVGRPRARR
jgi:hypothetical protein